MIDQDPWDVQFDELEEEGKSDQEAVESDKAFDRNVDKIEEESYNEEDEDIDNAEFTKKQLLKGDF